MSEKSRHSNGLKTLDYVVSTILMDMDDYSTHKRKKILQYAIFGLRELRMYVSTNVEVTYLKLNRSNSAILPLDFIDYSKVGIEVNGRVYTLTEDPNLALPRKTDECGEIEPIDTSIDKEDIPAPDYYYYYFLSHYRNGQYVGERYGERGGRNVAYFRIDKERNQIAISNSLSGSNGEIILEYISDGVNPSGGTVVPVQAVQVLRAYIKWELANNDGKSTESKINRLWEQYLSLYSKYQFFEHMPTKDEWIDHVRKHSSAMPRA